MAALTEGLSISLLIPLFSVVFHQKSGFRVIDEFVAWLGKGSSQEGLVASLVLIVLSLAALRAAVLSLYEITSIRVSGRVVHELRTALFHQLLRVGYVYFLGADRGRLLDMLRSETWRLGEVLLGFSRILISACTILGLGVFLLLISPWMTLGVAAAGLVITLILRLMVLRARRLGREQVNRGAVMSRRTSELLAGMRTIRLFGQERSEHERLSRASDGLRVAIERVQLTAAAIPAATELLYTPLFLGVLLAAWIKGDSLPTLVGFMALLYRIQPHARRLDHLRVEIAGHFPIVQQIAELLSTEDKPYVRSGNTPFSGFHRAVAFDDVTFAYEVDSDRPATVSGLSFAISRNKVTAIVGQSGAGKSTIVNLLFRLHDPDSGQIRVDDTPLQELSISDWRARLAFAGQDAELIGDTIHEAIAFARPDADRAAVQMAAEAANAVEFIERLPQGYETPIGPEGLRLSAGQRQRLALARALLCEPEILVLDEATNALDPLSERLIQSALDRLKGRLTMVVIAHRPGSIESADHVVVLKGGRVAEQGAPGDLLSGGTGVFAELWLARSSPSDRASVE